MTDQQNIPDGWVLAEWAGTGPVLLARERRVLNPGDVAAVPAGEAEESGNWRPTAPKSSKAAPAAEEAAEK